MKNKVTAGGVKRTSWSWQQYLTESNTQAAPVSVFTQDQSYPSNRHEFQVGMKVEGIDPLHPSMFCVLSVAEVIGSRLRLHIDSYSECYDFWVNSDSPDIRPAGWCQQNNHKLHPPKGFSETGFDWPMYLQSTNSQAAPENLFKVHSSSGAPCRFQVGVKLEAVDRKNPCLVCVASVSDVIDQRRLLIHFDNWDDTYDYWCDSSSPYIHPIGWCEEQGRPLTAPQGHPSPETFLWDVYLEETGATAAPRSAFTSRAPHGFQVHHKLEAVDRRNPMLIRVASITETEAYRVKIHYDGWSDQFDVWCDSDLCDLHPVGWCHRTGHPLETPADPSLLPSPSQGVCPTPGCRGVGHIKGAKYTGHHSAFGCPYSDMNLRKEAVLPDRLGGGRVMTLVPVTTTLPSPAPSPHLHQNQRDRLCSGGTGGGRPRGRPPAGGLQVKKEPRDDQLCQEAGLLLPLGKRSRGLSRSSEPTRFLRLKKEEEEPQLTSSLPVPESSLQAVLHQSVFLSRELPVCWEHHSKLLPVCWEHHSKLLPGAAGLDANTVQTWSIQQVSEFIESLLGCEEQAKMFKEEQIDGRAFLLLTQRDILRIMSIKLGPALKIYNSILMFKHADNKGQSQSDEKDT